MEQENAQHAVAVDSSKAVGLALGKFYKAQYQREEQQQHSCCSDKSLFLSYSTEYEVRVLLWHKLQLCLRTIKKSLSLKSSRAYGYLALVDVVSGTSKVLVKSEQNVYAGALVRLHDIVQHMVSRIEERY